MKPVCYATILALTAASGCIPVHDYSGDYDMTYDVILSFSDAGRPEARAGQARVEVHDGLAGEYLVNLGASLCRISGTYIEARTFEEWPHLEIAPQPCWFSELGKTLPMTLAGTATFGKGDERFTVVLSGTVRDDASKRVGSTTVQLTESW